MLEQLIGEANRLFDWVSAQLGWSGPLGWFQILLLALAVVGALVIVRNLIGGHSSGGGVGYQSMGYLPPSRARGFPTSFYTGGRKLGDFSVKKEVYDFKVPSPMPNLTKLREPVNFDLEKARRLFFMPPTSPLRGPTAILKPIRDLEGAEKSRGVVGDASRGTSQEAQQAMGTPIQEKEKYSGAFSPRPAGPNWELAQKLFIGKKPRLW